MLMGVEGYLRVFQDIPMIRFIILYQIDIIESYSHFVSNYYQVNDGWFFSMDRPEFFVLGSQ